MTLDNSVFFWGSNLHKQVSTTLSDTQAFAVKAQAEQAAKAATKAATPNPDPNTTTPTPAAGNTALLTELLAKALLAQETHNISPDRATNTIAPTEPSTGLAYNELFWAVFLEYYKGVMGQADVEAQADNPQLPDDSILARQRQSPALNWTF
jgi:hypothetical protein